MIDTAVTLRQYHHSRKHHITNSGNPEKSRWVQAGRSRTRTAQYHPCDLHAGLRQAAQKDLQPDEQGTVQVRLLHQAKEKARDAKSRAFLVGHEGFEPPLERL